MKRKVLALLLVLTLLVPYIPATNTAVYASSVIGTSGTIPAGGTTGAGGGISLTPSFRVGIVSETFRNPLDFEDPTSIIGDIEQHYINHYPTMSNSIIFSPSEVYVDPTQALLGWANLSSGDLNYVGNTLMPYKHRKIQDTIMDPRV